jgi:predicted dehydrogenase
VAPARVIGVIGAGAISRTVHLPVLTSMDGVRVAFVADADDARAASVAASFGVLHAPIASIEKAVAACDIVLLALPVSVRIPYLEILSRCGVAAFVEKPFARTVAEHQRIVGLFPPHRIVCGLMRRTYASTSLVRHVVRRDWFGRPRRIRVSEGGRTTKTGVDHSYFDDPQAGGGVLLELGCHALDLVMQLTGAVDHLIVSQDMLLDGSADRRAAGEVLLFTEPNRSGSPIPVDYRFSWLDRQEDHIEIEFPSVRLRVPARPEAPVTILGPGDDRHVARVLPPAGGATTSNQAFFLEWRWALAALGTGVASPIAASSCLGVTALIEDLYEAARGPA